VIVALDMDMSAYGMRKTKLNQKFVNDVKELVLRRQAMIKREDGAKLTYDCLVTQRDVATSERNTIKEKFIKLKTILEEALQQIAQGGGKSSYEQSDNPHDTIKNLKQMAINALIATKDISV